MVGEIVFVTETVKESDMVGETEVVKEMVVVADTVELWEGEAVVV